MKTLRKMFKSTLAMMIYVGYGGIFIHLLVILFAYLTDKYDLIELILKGAFLSLLFGIVCHVLFHFLFRKDPPSYIGQRVDLLPNDREPEVMLVPFDIDLQRYRIVSQGGLKMLGVYTCPSLFLVGIFLLIIAPSHPDLGFTFCAISLAVFILCWLYPSNRVITFDRTTGLVHMPGSLFHRRKKIRIVECHARYQRQASYPAGFSSAFMLLHEPSLMHYMLKLDGSGGPHEWTFLYRYMTRFYDDTKQQALIDEQLSFRKDWGWVKRFYVLGWRFFLPREWQKY